MDATQSGPSFTICLCEPGCNTNDLNSTGTHFKPCVQRTGPLLTNYPVVQVTRPLISSLSNPAQWIMASLLPASGRDLPVSRHWGELRDNGHALDTYREGHMEAGEEAAVTQATLGSPVSCCFGAQSWCYGPTMPMSPTSEPRMAAAVNHVPSACCAHLGAPGTAPSGPLPI